MFCVHKTYAPGVYLGNASTPTKTWDNLVEEGVIAISGTTASLDGFYADNPDSVAGSLVFPDGITTISGFKIQYSINYIVLPNSVTTIESNAFANCYGLTVIYFKGTEAEWNAVTKESGWINSINYGGDGTYTVYCSNKILTYPVLHEHYADSGEYCNFCGCPMVFEDEYGGGYGECRDY
ncbi:MAG: leucine-rich repeat protein [Clostridia bacterium]|nr:leucine-rich repeat protein [Clostridia bacterium]